MKNLFKKFLSVLITIAFLIPAFAFAAPFLVQQGGTGVGTITGIPYGTGTSALGVVSVGAGLSFVGGVLSNTGGTGTVTPSSVDTFTNKTYDTGAAGNSFLINGVAVTANTGTGAVVRATSPTLVTPSLGTPSAVVLTNATGLPIAGITGLGTGVGTWLATPSSANLAAAVTGETGTGALVFGTSPTISTGMTLGFLTGLTQCIHVNTSGVISGTGSDCGSGGGGATAQLDNLSVVAINAALVLGTSDAFALGSTTKQWSDLFLAEGGVVNWDNGDVTLTQAGDTLTVAGGVLVVPTSGLTINATNVTSTGTQLNYLNAATGTTGTTSTNVVFSTSPTLVTPTLGVASATSINKVAITAPATSATITIADGKTLTASNSLTLAGTDGKGINIGATTSGKILVGDGSNMVLSTPTFPNASATSGKIIKSDGTNWVASTETYAAPGTSGNVMTSNGTNWISSPGSSQVNISSIFETAARFTTTLSSGSATFNTTGVTIATSATSNRGAEVKMNLSGNGAVYTGSPTFSATFAPTTIGAGTNSGTFYIGMGTVWGSTPLAYTADHIGFKILTTGGVASLYATQASGATENASSALTTLVTTDTVDVYLKVNGTSSVDYYWRLNGGAWSSATNLTSNLPTSSTETVVFSTSIANATSNAHTVQVASFGYSR